VGVAVWQAAARRFSQSFRDSYGDTMPQFAEASFSEVQEQAATEHRLLFVYIHSPLNQDTEAFCRWVGVGALDVAVCACGRNVGVSYAG
jgi:hypothetical protein